MDAAFFLAVEEVGLRVEEVLCADPASGKTMQRRKETAINLASKLRNGTLPNLVPEIRSHDGDVVFGKTAY